MAIVGDAYIVVKAITSGFESDVRKAASGIDLNKDGKSVGESFSRGFGSGLSGGMGSALSNFDRQALAARKQFQSLVRTGYTLGPILSVLVSTIGTLAGGLVSLGSALVAAAPSAIVFATALTSIGIAAIGLTTALKGVGAAISAGSKLQKGSIKDTEAEEAAKQRLLRVTERVTEAQEDFTKAVREAKEEVQQLGFDAEDAALAEKRAAIELEKARETLKRSQDLPPNSRARREAALAFQEAELNLRKAKDRNADLRKEQERLRDSAAEAGTEQYEVTETYLDAVKSQRDAVLEQAEAEKALKKAKAGGAADTAYTDAMSDLSKEAQGFVEYMVNTFMPSLKELREALGTRLFSQLESGLEKLRTKLFPGLKPVLTELGDSIGKSFGTITEAITDIENIGDLEQVIRNAGTNIESYARTVSSLYDGFLSTLISAQPLADKFNKFLEKKTAGWAAYLDATQATGELQILFDKAGDIAARIGTVFGNAISGIVNITKANFTPGGGGYILLDYFKDVTAEFEKFSGSVAGQDALSDYFKGVAENSKAVLSSLGALIKEILKAGADPNIKVFWDILKEAAPILGGVLKELNKSAPSFAKFLVGFAEFTKVTISSGAITVFWTVLTQALVAVTNALSNPAVKEFFDNAAKVLAFFSAVGLISSALVFAGKVIAGSFLAIAKVLGSLLNPISAVKLALEPLITTITGISTPVLIAVAAIAAVVAVLYLAYQNSEQFRDAISGLMSSVGGALSEAFDSIKIAFEGLEPALKGTSKIFKTIGDILAIAVVPVLKFVLVSAIKTVSGAIVGLITTVGRLGGAFGSMAGAVSTAFSGVISVVRGAINGIINLWNSTLGKVNFTLPKVGPFGGGSIGFPRIPNLAEGGTVYPSNSGTITRVAEAGRPERIEPLDANGLSVRDKAMIELLATNSNNKTTDLTVNVYPSQGMNESELASVVSRQIAFQLRRGGA